MNFNKSILYIGLIVCCIAVNMQARPFEVFVKKQRMRTLDNEPITEIFPYKVMNIEGQYPGAVDNPTYGQIRKAIAEAFNLDPHWRNFTVRYVNNGKFYFLKPYIEKLSRKERAAFFDKISQSGFMNMPTLVVAKREPEEMGRAMQAARQMGISVQELEAQERQERRRPIVPTKTETTELGWDLEETLVGESDPILLEQLRAAKEKYK